jgi:hypothetical protein
MKSITNRILLFLVLGILTTAVGLGKTTRKEVTFSDPVTVNGTLVKSGTYELAFDDQTNQLSILKGRKVIATAEARVEKVEEKMKSSYRTLSDSDDASKPPALVSISLTHGNQATIVNSGN